MHFSLLIGNMRRTIVLNAALLLVVVIGRACRNSVEKRINKDIIGINEHLYDLEKNQISDANRLKKLESEIKTFKKEEVQGKEAANADYALYKIGLIYLEMKNNTRVLLAVNRLVNEYPDSDHYKTVSLKIKELKNKNRRTQ